MCLKKLSTKLSYRDLETTKLYRDNCMMCDEWLWTAVQLYSMECTQVKWLHFIHTQVWIWKISSNFVVSLTSQRQMCFGSARWERLTEMSSDWQAHIAAFTGCFIERCGKSATSSAIEMPSSALIPSPNKTLVTKLGLWWFDASLTLWWRILVCI